MSGDLPRSRLPRRRRTLGRRPQAIRSWLLFLLALGTAACPTPEETTQGVVWESDSLAAVQARAEMEGTPLLVLLCPESDPGCGGLVQQADIPEMRDRLEGLLLMRLSSRSPDGGRLLRTHGVSQLPAFLLFSSDGILLVRRDGADDYSVLQPYPESPLPLREVADFRLEEYEQTQRRREELSYRAKDPEETILMAEQAVESGSRQRAGEILARLDVDSLNLRQLVTAGDLAEKVNRPDVAVEFWHTMIQKYPGIGARDQALDRYARTLIQSAQIDRLERFVFGTSSLRSQWEYLTVATATSSAGAPDLAARIARDGLSRYPTGPHTDALKFYTSN